MPKPKRREREAKAKAKKAAKAPKGRKPRQPSPQPHDAFFKWAFTQREHAAGLLRAALPAELAAAIDFSTLRVEPGTFVDRALRSRYSDLVLSVRLHGRPLYIYSLVEHQRDVEALMILRMGIYMMRFWEQLVRDQPKTKELPPVIPVVVHHSDTGWTAATAFQDIIAVEPALLPVMRPYIPHFELRLIDISEDQASQLVDHALTALGRIVLWCMSVADNDERLEQELDQLSAALEEVVQSPNGLAALEVLLRYLLATHRQLDVTEVVKLMEKAGGPRNILGVWTELDEIERRGERRGERNGERRGERKGKAKQLLLQLAARFGTVPPEIAAKVDAAGQRLLDRWAVRVLTAATPEEVVADGKNGGKAAISSGRGAVSRKAPTRTRAARSTRASQSQG